MQGPLFKLDATLPPRRLIKFETLPVNAIAGRKTSVVDLWARFGGVEWWLGDTALMCSSRTPIEVNSFYPLSAGQ